MGNIGEPMTNPTVPPVGTAGTGYATTINAFLTEVKQRLEDPVPLSSVSITALDMANSPIQNVEYLSFAETAILPDEPAGSIWFYDGEFYMITSTGSVKVTDGLTLNVAANGGITGDYGGGNPAQLRFIDVDETYFFYDDFAGGAWARAWARSFDVASGATGANRVRIQFAGGADYDMTLPAVLPADQSLLQMSTAGVVTASNTIAEPITATDFRYTTDQAVYFPGSAFNNITAGSHTEIVAASGARVGWTINSTSERLWLPLPTRVGDVITNYTVFWDKQTASPNQVKSQIWRREIASTSLESIQGVEGTFGGAAGYRTTGDNTMNVTVLDGYVYYITVWAPDAIGDRLLGAALTTTRP